MESSNYLFQAFIYLAAAVVSVPIAKRLGLGSVLGYLLAGVIIGPHVFGFIGDARGDVMNVAQFGVVMMLFLVGLELRPNVLWRLRGPIFGSGTLQVVVTALICAVLALCFHLAIGPAIAIGLILSDSSTAIAVQSLSEKGWLNTKGGQTSVAVLLFQDLAVIPILAVIPFLAATHPTPAAATHSATWFQALLVLATVAAIVIGGRFLVGPVFHFLALTRLHEIFTAAALLLVVGIALAMQLIGLSPALGTFLAGVVLAESEYRHELEADIEPFKGLLLGLFFVSVGASIDLSLIQSQPILMCSLVIGLLLIKAAVLYGIGKISRLENSQNFTFSLALAQGGEFAFVLVAFAVHNRVFDQGLGDRLIAVVALSMVAAPFLFTINEFWIQPRFSSRLRERQPDQIDEINPVIIAGVGRYGAVVARLLNAQNIKTTVLDFDPEQVDLIRKIGFKVFYGDATRHEMLAAAGADRAKLLLIAIDDVEGSLGLVQLAQKHFPNLNLLVRARDREHAYRLIRMGVRNIFRETLESSLEMSVEALRLLGFGAYRAYRAAHTFKEYDEETVRVLAEYYGTDEKDFLGQIRKRVQTLDELFESERAVSPAPDSAWVRPKAAEKPEARRQEPGARS
ncbi:MAG TPA: monovalent cation:proton antiporter-2 (CPA2) family protein [Chthoniobacterales bacterium]|nr:monovalent cation:proton antiporter-2 (CPA2) family protein [Chthoniobacterales bacterium]